MSLSYGNFRKYGTVSCSTSAMLQNAVAMKAYGAKMIKVYQQPRRSQRIYFAQACRDEHMLLTAEGAGELDTDMTMVLDGFTAWEHAIPLAATRSRTMRRAYLFFMDNRFAPNGYFALIPWGKNELSFGFFFITPTSFSLICLEARNSFKVPRVIH
jgi:hypothetical protein